MSVTLQGGLIMAGSFASSVAGSKSGVISTHEHVLHTRYQIITRKQESCFVACRLALTHVPCILQIGSSVHCAV